MKRWCTLVFPLLVCTSVLCGYASPQDRQYVDYFLHLQAAGLFRSQSFLLNWSCAYINGNRLQGVDFSFSCYRTLSVNEARKMLVSVAEELVRGINNDPSIKERHLLPEPFKLNQLYLKIETENVFSAQCDPETIRVMILDRGNISYESYRASTLYYGRSQTECETLEMAQLLIGEIPPSASTISRQAAAPKATITEAPPTAPSAPSERTTPRVTRLAPENPLENAQPIRYVKELLPPTEFPKPGLEVPLSESSSVYWEEAVPPEPMWIRQLRATGGVVSLTGSRLPPQLPKIRVEEKVPGPSGTAQWSEVESQKGSGASSERGLKKVPEVQSETQFPSPAATNAKSQRRSLEEKGSSGAARQTFPMLHDLWKQAFPGPSEELPKLPAPDEKEAQRPQPELQSLWKQPFPQPPKIQSGATVEEEVHQQTGDDAQPPKPRDESPALQGPSQKQALSTPTWIDRLFGIFTKAKTDTNVPVQMASSEKPSLSASGWTDIQLEAFAAPQVEESAAQPIPELSAYTRDLSQEQSFPAPTWTELQLEARATLPIDESEIQQILPKTDTIVRMEAPKDRPLPAPTWNRLQLDAIGTLKLDEDKNLPPLPDAGVYTRLNPTKDQAFPVPAWDGLQLEASVAPKDHGNEAQQPISRVDVRDRLNPTKEQSFPVPVWDGLRLEAFAEPQIDRNEVFQPPFKADVRGRLSPAKDQAFPVPVWDGLQLEAFAVPKIDEAQQSPSELEARVQSSSSQERGFPFPVWDGLRLEAFARPESQVQQMIPEIDVRVRSSTFQEQPFPVPMWNGLQLEAFASPKIGEVESQRILSELGACIRSSPSQEQSFPAPTSEGLPPESFVVPRDNESEIQRLLSKLGIDEYGVQSIQEQALPTQPEAQVNGSDEEEKTPQIEGQSQDQGTPESSSEDLPNISPPHEVLEPTPIETPPPELLSVDRWFENMGFSQVEEPKDGHQAEEPSQMESVPTESAQPADPWLLWLTPPSSEDDGLADALADMDDSIPYAADDVLSTAEDAIERDCRAFSIADRLGDVCRPDEVWKDLDQDDYCPSDDEEIDQPITPAAPSSAAHVAVSSETAESDGAKSDETKTLIADRLGDVCRPDEVWKDLDQDDYCPSDDDELDEEVLPGPTATVSQSQAIG